MSTATELFEVHNQESAPAGSQDALAAAKSKFGFIPNLLGALANSPVALRSYVTVTEAFDEGTLSARERQLVLLAASVENECEYCVPAHSTILKNMLKIDSQTVSDVREGQTLSDNRLNALVNFTRDVVRHRGRLPAESIEHFLNAGFRKEQILEVLVGVSLKTISNYIDHISPVELDSAFAAER